MERIQGDSELNSLLDVLDNVFRRSKLNPTSRQRNLLRQVAVEVHQADRSSRHAEVTLGLLEERMNTRRTTLRKHVENTADLLHLGGGLGNLIIFVKVALAALRIVEHRQAEEVLVELTMMNAIYVRRLEAWDR